ncbi:hypothetical protein [Telmatospirillum sp. J64-1]|uniref:hypothetical protein n=1 Tax=Telmatospirillum sp. J64-1 TaxID=2502183 RepID=UPI00115C8D01|nr:hypothetical protein [Telmatospirillum sp. J64-1]
MKRISRVLLLSSAFALPVLPVLATEQQEPPGEPAGDLQEMVQKVKIVTRANANLKVPENEPSPFDLMLEEVPGATRDLTEGVTAKAFARYVAIEDRLIGQVVLSAVEKDGRIEPLNAHDFATQMDLEQPEIDPSKPITVEGNQTELIAALRRLAEKPEEEKKEEKKETAAAEGTSSSAGTGAGSNAGQNPDAASYKNPEPLDIKDTPPPTVRVTNDGCDIRVDLAQGYAIQQSRVETIENGKTSYTPCEDGNDRFKIERSYAACTDAVDLEARRATARYVQYYVDRGGSRREVTECTPDEERIFPIVEKRDSCSVFLDYSSLQAVPRAALVYRNANNAEVQVRGCEASTEVAAVPMVSTTDGCSIRHDFAAGRSHQLGRHQYEMDGVIWQADACSDNGTTYPHEKVYQNSAGAYICSPIIDQAGSTVTMQSRLRIRVDGMEQYITDCTPDTTGTAIIATTEGCENPATWEHDFSAGISYARERHYYMRNGVREYITSCQNSTTTYTHQIETVGWQNHDGQRYAYPLSTVYITPPSGRFNIKSGEVLQGAAQVPYIFERNQNIGTGKWSEITGCSGFQEVERFEVYKRPDESEVSYKIGMGQEGPVESCQPTGHFVSRTWIKPLASDICWAVNDTRGVRNFSVSIPRATGAVRQVVEQTAPVRVNPNQEYFLGEWVTTWQTPSNPHPTYREEQEYIGDYENGGGIHRVYYISNPKHPTNGWGPNAIPTGGVGHCYSDSTTEDLARHQNISTPVTKTCWTRTPGIPGGDEAEVCAPGTW